MTAPAHTIVDATADQLPAAASIIGAAFADLAIAKWLMPGETQTDRARILTRQLGLVVAHAHKHGRVHVQQHVHGVAVWLPGGDSTETGEILDYEQRCAGICGRHYHRFAHLDELMAAAHPKTPHWHLALLAVIPAQHGKGIGTALLAAGHAVTQGSPTFLQASGPVSRQLYLRHGYYDTLHPLVPDTHDASVVMYPMWRPNPLGTSAGTAMTLPARSPKPHPVSII